VFYVYGNADSATSSNKVVVSQLTSIQAEAGSLDSDSQTCPGSKHRILIFWRHQARDVLRRGNRASKRVE
jgi:hypothetical protein